MSEDITLSELFVIAEQQEEKGMTLGNALKAGLQIVVSPITSFPDKMSDKLLEITHYQDDNVAIPSTTKTLLGEDFSTLYESTKINTHASSNGQDMPYIESTSSYRTEMEGLVSSKWLSYDLCAPEYKAAFEVVLLSKKYANAYDLSTPEANDVAAKEYGEKMAAYKSYCDNNGIDWDYIMGNASAELQIQSYNYKEASESLMSVGNLDKERITANRAHEMLKSCMTNPEDDKLPMRLEGKITYEETLDLSENENAKFLNKFFAKAKETYEKAVEFYHNSKILHPFRTIKEATVKTINKIEGFDSSQLYDSTTNDATADTSYDGGVDF